LVIAGRSRSKNGVASLAHVPAAHAAGTLSDNGRSRALRFGMDARVKRVQDEGDRAPTRVNTFKNTSSPTTNGTDTMYQPNLQHVLAKSSFSSASLPRTV
jgi:hypothetical protein